MSEERHPGISMHKLPVGAGFIGLVFTVGSMLIFLLALPELWYFVAAGALLGIVLAIAFRVINNHRSERSKPLSILSVNEETGHKEAEAQRSQNQFPSQPIVCVQHT